jgi:hypothetical protein
MMGYHCTLKHIEEVFNVPTTTSSNIIASKRARRLEHSDEPDVRGRPRKLTNQDANSIATYIDEAPFEEKGDSWEDLAFAAGVITHKEFEENKENSMHGRTIQRHVTEVSGIKTFKAAKKEDLDNSIKAQRVDWCILQLLLRPHRKSWRQVIWCDEIHNSSSSRHVKRIKRRPDTRFDPRNIQYDKKARQPELDELVEQRFHFFCVVGYDFAWCIDYDAGNSNGKMNGRTYMSRILPLLKQEILGKELILWQDRDSAHVSKKVLDWMDLNGMDYLNSPPKSPDLSIMETWVHPLRKRFTARRVETAEAGIQRFYRVWRKLDQEKVNKTIDAYPKRLSECIHTYNGAMTKYEAIHYLVHKLRTQKPCDMQFR